MSDAKAFATSVEPHLPRLAALACRLSGPAEADDLVQETLLKAWAAKNRPAPGGAWGGFLTRILYNTFVSAHRKRAVRARVARRRDPSASGVSAASRALADDPGARLAARLDADRALAGLGELPAPQRDVVRLVDVYGYSYREAMTSLGVAPGTVMSRLHRGRRRLRAYLAAGGPRGAIRAA